MARHGCLLDSLGTSVTPMSCLETGVHDHLTREGNAVWADKSQRSQSQLNTLSVHVLRSHRDQLVYSVAVLSFLISVGFGILYYAKKHDPQYGPVPCRAHAKLTNTRVHALLFGPTHPTGLWETLTWLACSCRR